MFGVLLSVFSCGVQMLYRNLLSGIVVFQTRISVNIPYIGGNQQKNGRSSSRSEEMFRNYVNLLGILINYHLQ